MAPEVSEHTSALENVSVWLHAGRRGHRNPHVHEIPGVHPGGAAQPSSAVPAAGGAASVPIKPRGAARACPCRCGAAAVCADRSGGPQRPLQGLFGACLYPDLASSLYLHLCFQDIFAGGPGCMCGAKQSVRGLSLVCHFFSNTRWWAWTNHSGVAVSCRFT